MIRLIALPLAFFLTTGCASLEGLENPVAMESTEDAGEPEKVIRGGTAFCFRIETPKEVPHYYVCQDETGTTCIVGSKGGIQCWNH